MSDVVLRCEHVGKKYCKSLTRSMLYGAVDIFKSSFGVIPDSTRLRPDEFWAVDGVDFELKKGESLGIIGPNGSGKTTLLKMLNGIFMPDRGKITVEGKVGGLIQVGAGFHPMLSGRENIYINGTILGLTKKEIDRCFDAIVDFADIGDFLDSPVKFYSSGMYVRLGFAIAVHSRPDILLIDEVLAVGDLKFQSKCLKFITNNILKNGCSIVFVSHSRYAVEDVCQKALYLKNAAVKKMGNTREVVEQYLLDIKNEERTVENASFETEGITKIDFMGEEDTPINDYVAGQKMRIRFYYSFKETVFNPSVAVTFVHNDPRFTLVSSTDYIFNLHSGYDGFNVPQLQGQGFYEVIVDHVYLPVGIYKVFGYLYTENNLNLVRKYEHLGPIEIHWSKDFPQRSLVELPHAWRRQEGGS